MSEQDVRAEMHRAAMNWLSRRDYARRELGRRLERRFGEEAPVDAILDWLEEQNFLNEARFAEAFVRSRIDRGQGALRIRAELEQRGLEAARIEQALEQVMEETGCDWFELAARVRQRRFPAPPGGNPREKAREKARQLRFLQYRGFTPEQAFRAMEAAHSGDAPEGLPDEEVPGEACGMEGDNPDSAEQGEGRE